jgi:hypothetical protein
MKRKHKIDGQFVPRLIEMLRSPAFRALSLTGHRIFARIEIELASHGGRDNGKLPVTFADFERYGIERHAIGPGIRVACALGLVEVTRPGRPGGGEYRKPNLFRLTYLPAYGKAPTHEWRRIKTIEQAEKIARKVRRTIKKQKFSRWGNHTGKGGETTPATSAEKPTVDPVSQVGKPHHYLDKDLAISPSGASQQGHRLSGQPPSGITPRRLADGGDPVPFHRSNRRRNSHVKN